MSIKSKKKVILLTNNNSSFQILKSQLLNYYVSNEWEKVLFCKKDDDTKLDCHKYVPTYSHFKLISYIKYFFKLFFVIFFDDFTLIHCRGFVSGVILFPFAFLKNVRYVYDPRGPIVYETIEKGLPYSIVFIFSKMEKYLIKNSLFTIVETENLKSYYSDRYGLDNKYLLIYNTTVFPYIKKKVNFNNDINAVYVGTFNKWHDKDELISIYKHLNSLFYDKINFFVFTAERNFYLKKYFENELNKSVVFEFHKYESLQENLLRMDIAISMVKPTLSTKMASPIKISDYISCSLPIITSSGVGDFDEFFINNESAIVYEYGTPNFERKQVISLNPNLNKSLYNLVSFETAFSVFHDRLEVTLVD